MTKVKIVNLRKRFRSTIPGRSFELFINELHIGKSEILYIVGPNGSGKTTLLSLLQGSLKPDSGEILLKTESSQEMINVLGIEAYKRSRFFGVVTQDSDEALVNEMTILDHVLVGLSRSGRVPWFFPRYRHTEYVKEILYRFDLGFEERLQEPVGNLSGGERQVLTFCMATLNKPEILLLDEFTAAMDPEMAKKVLLRVVSHIRSNLLTALVVTHRHREAINNADRIVVLHKGKPYLEINKDNPEFREEFLQNIFLELYQY